MNFIFEMKYEKFIFLRLRTCCLKKRTSTLRTSNNATWREGRWTGVGNHVFPGDYLVFLTGDRETKCLGGDRQKTVWCLQQDQLCYLRNRRTKTLDVSYRTPDKLGSRSNSLTFCTVSEKSHTSLELCTFRCLVGHVCQRWGPVSCKTVGTMVDVFQVMIVNTIICKIQDSRLTTLVCNESRCNFKCSEILDILTMNLELKSPLFSWFLILQNAKSRPTFWRVLSSSVWPQKSNNDNWRYWKFYCQNQTKTKI
jgi:hypothetical protein